MWIDLALVVNMKVLYMDVLFPLALVSLQNVFYNLIYGQITTHRSRGILHETLS